MQSIHSYLSTYWTFLTMQWSLTGVQAKLLAWCLPFSLLVWHTPVWAQPTLSIHVIEAQKSHTYTVDDQLNSMASTLKSSFKNLNQFKLLDSLDVPLKRGQKNKIKLPKGLKVNVSIKKVSNKIIKLLLHIPRKKSTLKINAKPKELFFQAMKWKGKFYILAFKSLG